MLGVALAVRKILVRFSRIVCPLCKNGEGDLKMSVKLRKNNLFKEIFKKLKNEGKLFGDFYQQIFLKFVWNEFVRKNLKNKQLPKNKNWVPRRYLNPNFLS